MKYINFNSVVIKNFLSVGETPVTVNFNQGLNIITGNNKDKVDRRNGVGKSTVADSIYFAIYGTTLRELKKDHIINNITQRNCVVELNFDVNIDGKSNQYKIVRKIAPSKCLLYKDGEDITRDSIVNTTEYICELLNTTSDVFQNCVIMTINNVTPFMAKKKLDKRKFIEGILNLQVFSDMLTGVRTEYNSVVRELDIECAKYEEISNNINTLNEQKQNIENDRLRSRNKLLARRDSCQKDLDRLSEQRDTIKSIEIKNVADQITTVAEYITKADSKVNMLVKEHTKIKTLIEVNQQKHAQMNSEHAQCPVCLHDLDESHKTYIEKEKYTLEQQVEQLEGDRKTVRKRLDKARSIHQQLTNEKVKLNEKLNQANIQKQNLINVETQIKQLNTQLKDITDDVESLNKQDNTVDKQIADITKRLEEKQHGIDVIKKTIARLDVIKFVVSEEGVKSYIVKKILQLLNSKLAYYLKKMDSNCICVFNEYFEEEIIDEKGKLCSYFNFSGAERKNIDLACLFAFMDIRRLQGDVAFNFSMYDELFDSSLDERGVELVIEILKERIENYRECVMVISHRKESTKMATGEIIFLEKQNGVTTRIETPQSELK